MQGVTTHSRPLLARYLRYQWLGGVAKTGQQGGAHVEEFFIQQEQLLKTTKPILPEYLEGLVNCLPYWVHSRHHILVHFLPHQLHPILSILH